MGVEECKRHSRKRSQQEKNQVQNIIKKEDN